jgi:hypothetical protein
LPPTLVYTMSRTAWLANPEFAGFGINVVGAIGLAVQVASHLAAEAEATFTAASVTTPASTAMPDDLTPSA